MLSTASPIFAEQRMIDFEMVEGHILSFPMTAQEAEAFEEYKVVVKSINARNKLNGSPVKSYELPESGITIDFPMSDKELVEHKKFSKLVNEINERNRVNAEDDEKMDVIEMADGHFVVFK